MDKDDKMQKRINNKEFTDSSDDLKVDEFVSQEIMAQTPICLIRKSNGQEARLPLRWAYGFVFVLMVSTYLLGIFTSRYFFPPDNAAMTALIQESNAERRQQQDYLAATQNLMQRLSGFLDALKAIEQQKNAQETSDDRNQRQQKEK